MLAHLKGLNICLRTCIISLFKYICFSCEVQFRLAPVTIAPLLHSENSSISFPTSPLLACHLHLICILLCKGLKRARLVVIYWLKLISFQYFLIQLQPHLMMKLSPRSRAISVSLFRCDVISAATHFSSQSLTMQCISPCFASFSSKEITLE